MEEGIVIEWSRSLGETVEKGEIILIIESEKSEVEIESPGSGIFRHIFVEEGETVPCGTLLGAITETADEEFDFQKVLAECAVAAQDAALSPEDDLEISRQ